MGQSAHSRGLLDLFIDSKPGFGLELLRQGNELPNTWSGLKSRHSKAKVHHHPGQKQRQKFIITQGKSKGIVGNSRLRVPGNL